MISEDERAMFEFWRLRSLYTDRERLISIVATRHTTSLASAPRAPGRGRPCRLAAVRGLPRQGEEDK